MNFSPSLGIFCYMKNRRASPHWCCTETNRCFSCLSSYKWRRDDNSEQICPPQVVHSINGASWGRFAAALCVAFPGNQLLSPMWAPTGAFKQANPQKAAKNTSSLLFPYLSYPPAPPGESKGVPSLSWVCPRGSEQAPEPPQLAPFRYPHPLWWSSQWY